MVSRNTYVLVGVSIALVALFELIFPDRSHAHYWFHKLWGFDILYGFLGCIAIVFVSKTIGKAALWRTTYSLPMRASDVGHGVTWARVARWCVADGETVREGQPLLELETDRGLLVPIRSPAPGMVVRTFLDPGAMAQIDETLLDLEVSDASMKQINRALEEADA